MRLKRLYILSLLLLPPISSIGQSIPSEKILYDEVTDNSIERAYLKALCFYPELKNVKIRIKYGRIKTSMAAIPKPSSLLFRKRTNRTYTIIINKKEHSDPARLLHTAPFNAMVGVFGHELAHILDYKEKSNCQMVGFAISYLNHEKRKQTEWKTDSITVSHGLGWQLYHFTDFVFNEADINPKYRKYKTKYYMKPEALYQMVLRKEGAE